MNCAQCKKLEQKIQKLTTLLNDNQLIINNLVKDNEDMYEQREYNAQLCNYYDKEAKRVRSALTKIKCDLFPLATQYVELNATIRFIDDTLILQDKENEEVTVTISCTGNKSAI